MSEEYDYLFKTVVVGDGGVGKTALTLRFSKGFFTEDYKMTIGVDFHVKTISVDTDEGELKAKLQIWDTGGQERFSSIRPMYYRGSLGALLIFDLTSLSSFEHLPQWIEEVRANVESEIPLLLVGNKSDLVDQRAVSVQEIGEFTKKFNLYYMETSAKTGEGVGDCFYILACLMMSEGVPDQLIAEGIVSSPGVISISTPDISVKKEDVYSEVTAPLLVPEPKPVAPPEPLHKLEPEAEETLEVPTHPEPKPVVPPEPLHKLDPEAEEMLEVPPHPEPKPVTPPKPLQKFEPEAEEAFQAPPVPEPKPVAPPEPLHKFEPEAEEAFQAPPVPEPKPVTPIEPVYNFENESEKLPQTPNTSESTAPFIPFDAESNETKEQQATPVPEPTSSDTYKPKAVPFSAKTPVPTEIPEVFKAETASISPEISQDNETTLFDTTTKDKVIDTQRKDSSHLAPFTQATYTPPTSESLSKEKSKEKLSKKERKRLEKEKKKRAKEKAKKEKEKKLEEERRKHDELMKTMRNVEKEGVEEEGPIKEAPLFYKNVSQRKEEESKGGLFETLTKKSETEAPKIEKMYPSFSNDQESMEKQAANLRIIPAVEDSQTDMPAINNNVEDQSTSTVVCSNCGAVLSAEYKFCNKCGSKI